MIDVVEEDDDFEEFENDDWNVDDNDTTEAKWMDNWEDDDSGDMAFIEKLRDQLRSK